MCGRGHSSCCSALAHLLPDGELQTLHRLLRAQAVQVLVQVLLPPGCVRHKVFILAQEDHGFLPHAEEDHFLFGWEMVKSQGKKKKVHFLLQATGNNLLSDGTAVPQQSLTAGLMYNFVNFISIRVNFLAKVSTGMLLFSSDTHDRNFVFAQCYVSATAA